MISLIKPNTIGIMPQFLKLYTHCKTMKPTFLINLLALGLLAGPLVAAPAPSPISSATPVTYEELPELKASDILKPEFLSGPRYKVREEVSTSSGANQFTIDSDFGVFEADGNEMLVTRISEINAIARLKEVSRTDEFKEALQRATRSPV